MTILASHKKGSSSLKSYSGQRKEVFILEIVVGAAGFEPTNGSVKDCCLTAWRYPIISYDDDKHCHYISDKIQATSAYLCSKDHECGRNYIDGLG